MKYPNYQKRTKVYRVINNVTRIKLLLMVNKNIPLVYAAKQLQINYSTAKTIMRAFRNRNKLLNTKSQKFGIFHIFKQELKSSNPKKHYIRSKSTRKESTTSKNLSNMDMSEMINLLNLREELTQKILLNQIIINSFYAFSPLYIPLID